MNIVDIITKKKNNEPLSKEEINYVINSYMNEEIKDYQMSSLLMAIVLNGMNEEETIYLTDAMIKSGDVLDLSAINGTIVDKHSTGGIGDKTSLVVLPLVSSLGVKIAKMSGRGLGFTGGTIDKLESIGGFNTKLSKEDFIKQVNDINMSIVSQTENLVPADKKIYALRDVTGTTESIPLIASSIMSKKIASGADKILLDVKVGKGAFMKNIDDARKLANMMVKIGKSYNKETIAILTNMDYPLGNAVGNSIEVLDAIDTLNDKGNKTFLDLCLVLSSYMVSMAKNISIDGALDLVNDSLNSKNGLNKLYEFISYQGGNINNINVSDNFFEVKAKKEGYITDIDSMKIASICNNLGAGRKNKEDIINYEVGIKLNKHINDKVKVGDTLFTIYYSDLLDENNYDDIFTIGEEKIDYQIIYEIIK